MKRRAFSLTMPTRAWWLLIGFLALAFLLHGLALVVFMGSWLDEGLYLLRSHAYAMDVVKI